ncbi:MAG TPA: hypothetical protein VII55_01635 [Candidatus Saccharimonadales bacterium]
MNEVPPDNPGFPPTPETPPQSPTSDVTDAPAMPNGLREGDVQSNTGEPTVQPDGFTPNLSPEQPNDEPQEDRNPKAPHVDGANYVDESTAWSLAHATKDFRGKAADNRAIARSQDEDHPKAVRIGDVVGEEPSRLRPLKHADYEGRLKGLQDEYYEFNEKTHAANVAADRQAIEDIPELQNTPDLVRDEGVSPEFARLFDGPPHWSPERRAEAYDRRADRIEEWAEILHDHPLSIEFKKAHRPEQFQPKALVRMEDRAKSLE